MICILRFPRVLQAKRIKNTRFLPPYNALCMPLPLIKMWSVFRLQNHIKLSLVDDHDNFSFFIAVLEIAHTLLFEMLSQLKN